MTTPRTILRDSALALPFLAALGAWLEGSWGAFGVVASGVITLANLAVLAWIVDRLVHAAATGEGGGAAVAVIFGKGLVALSAYALLLASFSGPSVALGFGAGLVGLVAYGVGEALRAPTASVEES